MTNTTDFPKPLGFPQCARCAYVLIGTPQGCAACAAQTMKPLAANHCVICSQTLDGQGTACRNIICGWDPATRCFTRVDAIALYSGYLETTLKRFKYDEGNKGWSIVFGRLIVGWLEAHQDEVTDIDLILGNPTAPGRSPLQHIEAIMAAARNEDTVSRWPLSDPGQPILVKTRETPKSAGGRVNWQEKMTAAREHAEALDLRGSVEGKRILLVDDVFTTGAQVHTVSKYLKTVGRASEVRGLVLARVSW
ncbi:ComF family protein [Streptomyces microflavus]|uniref:ComF family protein n=1 Tax=Streptomyces microflavus TaxID=1919 RepID=UPI0036577E40